MAKKLIATIALSVLAASPSFAWFGSKKAPQSSSSQTLNILNLETFNDEEVERRRILQDLSLKLAQQINDIQSAIDAKRSDYAMSLAKNALDDIKVKTGIDPKAQLRQKFLVPTVFPKGTQSMDTLPEDQKNLIIQTIKDFRGGLFLDIVNLSKRTTLLYIKALHAVILNSGALLIEDRNKIIKDLATISIYPMPVQDKDGQTITVYDNQVASEDHVYLFNREIKMYLLNSKDLGISEAEFIKYRDSLRGGNTPQMSPQDAAATGASCMKNAARLLGDGEINQAKITCFNKYKLAIGSFDVCNSLASQMLRDGDIATAKKFCFDRFN